jgi:hypothetical protein
MLYDAASSISNNTVELGSKSDKKAIASLTFILVPPNESVFRFVYLCATGFTLPKAV